MNVTKGEYEFKEDCNTEKKIAAKLKECTEKALLSGSEAQLRLNLFDLQRNVILIRDPEDARKFYPRFNLEDTTSFRDLDDHSKNVLRRLYYDYYFHRQENLWRQNALKTLPVLLNSSDMLACGEDLGLIPSCVHPVMQELGLIGLRIQRMPNEPDLEFGIPSQYGYMTVCAPSCHDCSTLRAWWEEDEDRRRRFFKTVVGSNKIPPSQCVPEIANFVLRQHFESPSMWAIFPLQFFLKLMKVPRVESKLRVFAFKMQFKSQLCDLINYLQIVNSASEEIGTSAKLKRVMLTILSLGNALNQGTARGAAVGFRLDSLLKLTDTRARNNKMTLMHYRAR